MRVIMNFKDFKEYGKREKRAIMLDSEPPPLPGLLALLNSKQADYLLK